MIKLTENLCDYRIASKPPIAGEPIITEIVTIIPKTMPTIRKRLFTNRVFRTPLKIDGLWIGERYGRRL